jgi:hypothetical protein
MYEEVLVKAAEWDDKRAINFVVNQWQTRCLQKVRTEVDFVCCCCFRRLFLPFGPLTHTQCDAVLLPSVSAAFPVRDISYSGVTHTELATPELVWSWRAIR